MRENAFIWGILKASLKKLLMGQSKWPITKKKALSFGMHPH
jgi:hypothetical protein